MSHALPMKQINVRKVCTDYYQHQIAYLPEPVLDSDYFERGNSIKEEPLHNEETAEIREKETIVKRCSVSSPWDL